MGGCNGGDMYWTYKNYMSKTKLALDCKYKYESGKSKKTGSCKMTTALEDKDSLLVKPNYGQPESVSALKGVLN